LTRVDLAFTRLPNLALNLIDRVFDSCHRNGALLESFNDSAAQLLIDKRFATPIVFNYTRQAEFRSLVGCKPGFTTLAFAAAAHLIAFAEQP
jgi:hypothetical protein